MALPHTKTSGSARTAVIYITIGAIIDVWTVIWYIWMVRHGTTSDAPYFWCYGFFFTGLILIVIGLALGKIGRFARHAEAPADVTDNKVAQSLASQPQVQQPNAQPGVQPAAPPAAGAPPVTTQPAAVPGGTVAPVAPPPSRAGAPGSL